MRDNFFFFFFFTNSLESKFFMTMFYRILTFHDPIKLYEKNNSKIENYFRTIYTPSKNYGA